MIGSDSRQDGKFSISDGHEGLAAHPDRIAVRIADGDGRHAHPVLSLESPKVREGFSRHEVRDENDRRRKPEGGLEAKGVLFPGPDIRIVTIESDSRPDHVEEKFRRFKEGCAAGRMSDAQSDAFRSRRRADVQKPFYLLSVEFGILGQGRADAVDLERGERGDIFDEGQGSVVGDAGPAHPRVDIDVDQRSRLQF